jgi:pimeloyl-ACP methyl ester carboxylesterase
VREERARASPGEPDAPRTDQTVDRRAREPVPHHPQRQLAHEGEAEAALDQALDREVVVGTERVAWAHARVVELQAAAWKTLPSWAVVASSDKAVSPDAERHMAQRAGAQTIEVDASHSIALSQPKAVADLIQTAIKATTPVTVGAS